MPMRVSHLADGEPFDPAAGHRGVAPATLQGGGTTPTERFTVVVSHYLPGAVVDPSPQPAETVYVVIAGELVMRSEGRQVRLAPLDSVHFTPGTVRSVRNESPHPASMLVIRARG